MTKPLEIQSYSEWNLFTRQERPLMIAGPCSAESEEQLFNTATKLKNNGIEVLRAGIWKPRSRSKRIALATKYPKGTGNENFHGSC